MPGNKPKLAQLTTPHNATFPSELSALSATSQTPLSAIPYVLKDDPFKTPISPPTAYLDFLHLIHLKSPTVPEKRPGSSDEEDDDEYKEGSMPSTASSEETDLSCKCGHTLKSPTSAAASPYPKVPASAPPTGASSFPSLHISATSPAPSTIDSPMSAVRSPFSARSTRSPFDWDAALSGHYSSAMRSTTSTTRSKRSIREIREVVTRTVTTSYSPRMDPAPKGKGKRRKTESSKTQPPSIPVPPTTRSNSA